MAGYLDSKLEKSITQDYQLIHSIYDLELRAKQILLFAISHLDPNKSPASQRDFKVTITARQWINTFGEKANPWDDLKTGCEELVGKRVWIDQGKSKWRHWVAGADYHYREGRATVILSNEILPFLCAPGGLERFSSMYLVHVAGLRSFNAVRLYELLNQFKFSGRRQFALNDFKKLMAVEDSYPKWFELRRRVIDPSVAEINKKSDLDVKYVQVKKGRQVSGLIFTVIEKRQGELFPRGAKEPIPVTAE